MFDFHCHILPGVDDGAKDTDEAVKLLEMMKEQGITDIVATPHFYAMNDNPETFKNRTVKAYNELLNATEGMDIPNIYLGAEVLYYRYLSQSDKIFDLCLNNSEYILIELDDFSIDAGLFDDLDTLISERGITPIIAHIERYRHSPNFKKLIKYVKENDIAAQVNSSSFLNRFEFRTVKKLVKSGVAKYIATDAHSVAQRPPLMSDALDIIIKKIGEEFASKLTENSANLLEKIKVVPFNADKQNT